MQSHNPRECWCGIDHSHPRAMKTDAIAGELAAIADAAIRDGQAVPYTDDQQRRRHALTEELERRDDDQRRVEEGDEQRDYAEERANAELMREANERWAAVPASAFDPLEQLTADELDELEPRDAGEALAIAAEFGRRLRQLEELAEGPALETLTARADRIRANARTQMARSPEHRARVMQIADQLDAAAQIIRENSPSRRRILRKLEA